eukprot:5704458-Amphidinium_carterae.1
MAICHGVAELTHYIATRWLKCQSSPHTVMPSIFSLRVLSSRLFDTPTSASGRFEPPCMFIFILTSLYHQYEDPLHT